MMKEQAIQRINKIGKISSIIARIARIVVGIGLVCAVLGAVICFVVPESLLKITMAGTMTMDMDFSELGVVMDEQEQAKAAAEMEKSMADSGDGIYSAVITTDDRSASIVGAMEEKSFTIRNIAWAIMLVSLELALTFVTICFTGALCKAFRDCHSPFEENVIRKMQHLAWALLPWCLISTVGDSTIDNLMNTGRINVSISVDLGVVLVVLIIFVLLLIFKYGAVLQQESDETL